MPLDPALWVWLVERSVLVLRFLRLFAANYFPNIVRFKKRFSLVSSVVVTRVSTLSIPILSE